MYNSYFLPLPGKIPADAPGSDVYNKSVISGTISKNVIVKGNSLKKGFSQGAWVHLCGFIIITHAAYEKMASHLLHIKIIVDAKIYHN